MQQPDSDNTSDPYAPQQSLLRNRGFHGLNLIQFALLCIKLITEALLLDPEHARQNQDEAIKAAIQQDAAECFLQLALFEPGQDMLAKEGVLRCATSPV